MFSSPCRMAQDGNNTKNIFLGVQQSQSAETALFPENSTLGDTNEESGCVTATLTCRLLVNSIDLVFLKNIF